MSVGDAFSMKPVQPLLLTAALGAAVFLGWHSVSCDTVQTIIHRQRPVASTVTSAQHAAGELAHSAQVVDLSELPNLNTIIPELATKRLVFIGENHDRFEHHLVQLAIISRLYERDSALAIGMEFFQVPFQSYLDDYVAGRLDDEALLEATEYFDRWGFDFRLYQPILRFAQENGIPLVALNVSKELVAKVSKRGIEGLAPGDRAQLPTRMNPADASYRERLRSVFELHPGSELKDFERFVEVQLLWDESMAETAARYLETNPKRSLVVLAGNGHLAFRSGIPERVQHRVQVDSAVVLNGADNGILPTVADYVVLPEERALPAAGRMEVLLDASADEVRIKSLEAGGAAAIAGMKAGDALVAVGGRPIRALTDIKIALWDRRPGERVSVHVRRDRKFFGQEDREFEVQLR
jgi:uncharacterized iron-regulated protein